MAKKHDTRKPKTVYCWQKGTNEYSGKAEAQPDPFVHDKWLIPARSTTEKPPEAKSGYVIKRDVENGKWVAEKIEG